MKVSIDFETYSELDIKKVGAWQYSKHHSTEVLCMAYAFGDESPKLWTPNVFPFPLTERNSLELHAWNSFFEFSIWKNVLKIDALPFEQWVDTMALAAAAALPLKLEESAKALQLPQDQQKDKRGKYLIQKLCKPNRGKRVEDPELLQELYEYCLQDVVTERAVSNKLRPLNKIEKQVWQLDQKINARGVPIDLDNVKYAIDLVSESKKNLDKKVQKITDFKLENTSQRAVVLDYIRNELEYPIENYQKAYLEEIVSKEETPEKVKEIVEIRLKAGKTSTAKYEKLKLITDEEDQRARGLLQYHVATTGRWGGRLFQPQNLTRGSFNDTENCISLFEERDTSLLDLIYGDSMEALSTCIRGMIAAKPGKKLVVSDYSSIEARGLAWAAGQEDILEIFRGHGKIYEHTASKIYKKLIEDIKKDERFIGKTATLALGYQGGVNAFLRMAKNYNVEIEESLAERVKTEWRKSNPMIVKFWYEIERIAKRAINYPGQIFSYRGIKFKLIKDSTLLCQLPSGRFLSYQRASLKFNKITFWGINSETHKWTEQDTYGGKLTENIIQALCRDIIAEAMLRLEDKGYEIILSVHDEIIAEVDKDFGSVEEFSKIMCELPSWAVGFPISAEGFECQRYRK